MTETDPTAMPPEESTRVPSDATAADHVAACISCFEVGGPAALNARLDHVPSTLREVVRRRVETLIDHGLVRPDASENDRPERIGRYRIKGLLGRGGMGVVFLAQRDDLSRDVALKVLPPGYTAADGARSRFKREIENLARLRHPGIVGIVDVGEETGAPWFAMELVAGRPLSDVIRSLRDAASAESSPTAVADCLDSSSPRLIGPRPIVAARIVADAADAVAYAHSRGVVHRDIKPSNMMVDANGRVVLLDFGLSVRDDVTRVTQTGTELGSLPYMAPEQILGDIRRIGQATDVYALGVTLYELVSLARPFAGATPEDLRRRILDGGASGLDSLVAATPRDLAAVCAKAMCEDSERRYASAAALADDLRRVLDRRPVSARRPGPFYRLRRFAERRPAAGLAIVLAVALFVVVPIVGSVVLARKNANLRRLLDDARTERAAAGAAYRKASRIIDEVVLELADDQLMWQPDLQSLRTWMLERALASHEDLALDRSGDVQLHRDLAESRCRVARIELELGHFDRAKDLLGEARRWLVDLDAQRDPSVVDLLVDVLHLTARAHQSTGNLMESAAPLEELVDLTEGALESAPLDPHLLDQAVRALVARAAFRNRAQDADAARADLEEARAKCEQLLALDAELEHQGIAAGVELSLAALRGAEPVDDASIAAHRRAIDVCERLANERPKDLEWRFETGRGHRILGIVLMRAGRFAEALDAYRSALQVDLHFADQFPWDVRFSDLAALSAIGVTQALDSLARGHEAGPYWRIAREKLERLARRFPDHPQRLAQHAVTLKSHAAYLAETGSDESVAMALARACGAFDRLLRSFPPEQIRESWREIASRAQAELDERLSLVDGVRAHELAARLIASAPALDLPEDEAESVNRVVVRLLAIAVRRGEYSFEELNRERDFAPLRSREDFSALQRID